MMKCVKGTSATSTTYHSNCPITRETLYWRNTEIGWSWEFLFLLWEAQGTGNERVLLLSSSLSMTPRCYAIAAAAVIACKRDARKVCFSRYRNILSLSINAALPSLLILAVRKSQITKQQITNFKKKNLKEKKKTISSTSPPPRTH